MRRQVSSLAAASLILAALLYVWTTIRQHQWQLQQQQIQESVKAHSASLKQQDAAEQSTSPESQAQKAQSGASVNPDGGYAYSFYATNDQYACSVLVNVYRLQQDLRSQIPIHVIASSKVSQAYISAFEERGVTVHIEQPPSFPAGAGGYYIDCLLKLLAFKLHRLAPGLRRVLAFDSDQLIMQNLDHLFSGLPVMDLAAPRAYWIVKDFLASTFLMISLSDRLWEDVDKALSTIGYGKFDMDLINDLLGAYASIDGLAEMRLLTLIPGDQVMMLSGEYVTLNSHWEDWNLPKWYHPTSDLNWTTIEKVNAMARPKMPTFFNSDSPGFAKRQVGRQAPNLSRSVTNSSSQLNFTAPKAQAEAPTLSPVLSESLVSKPPGPRFPGEHPLTRELYLLQESAAVVHFSAVGKPWTVTEDTIRYSKPDAHPLLDAQFHLWREIALKMCPDFASGQLGLLFPSK
ncbi:Glucose N-acetyltransferase 1 [Pseudocercospora fuligena]|uniref:Glucose N-acetyltransferase 1 n=1 Tax=Pseudocercospora fuligena TaxID=685502 RepID=A0A8H6RRL6_9PEZI|nr:Glucose N-acetyltransferase 1 [Pseudocercospora fuligena]